MSKRATGFIPDPQGHRWTKFKAAAAAKKMVVAYSVDDVLAEHRARGFAA